MGFITVYSPDGEPLNFPDTMTDAEIEDVMASQFPAPAPVTSQPEAAGYTLVESFPDGGRIMVDASGVETYVSSGGSTSDPKTIATIRRNQGNQPVAGETSVFAGLAAKDLVGEGATRYLSAMKGMPFLRGYVEPIAAFGSQMSSKVREATGQPVRGRGVSEDLYRQAIAGREMEAPKTVAASRLATGVGAGALALPAAPAASLLGRMAQGVAIGAPVAAAEGLVAGYGEGGAPEAISQAKSGAAFGAGFGAAGPLVGAGVGAATRNYLEKPVRGILDNLGFKGNAAEVVKDTLALDSADAVMSAQQAGPYGNIARMGGATEALLDTVANSPEGRQVVIKNLNETASLASNDLTKRMDDVLGKPLGDLTGQKASIMADTASARRELYGKAYDFQITPNSDEGAAVMSVFNRVSPSDLTGAQTLLREAGEASEYFAPKRIDADALNDLPTADRSRLNITSNADGTYTVSDTPTVASLDYLSRQLYDQSEALKRAGNTAAANSKRDLALQLRSALDDVNPDYAAARAAGKDAIDQRIAADLGNDILSPKLTRAEVERSIVGMDDVARKQTVQALRNKIDEIQANAKVNPTGNNDAEIVEALAALKALNTRAVSDKLRLVLGDEAAASLGQQITDTSGALMQRAAVASNSKTAIRGLVNERMKDITGESLGEQVGRQGLLPTASGAVTQALVGGPTQRARMDAVAREIAPVLTQRQSPEMLMQSARQMEALTPAIGRARRGGEAAREATQRTMMGLGLSQNMQGDSNQVDYFGNKLDALMKNLGLR